MKNRLNKDDYFLKIARVVAEQSTCAKHDVGAVLVRDNHILATGYNGAPSNIEHCIDVGCNRPYAPHGENYELCRAVHAEENAIIQCALHGVSTKGATLYCTHQPCLGCAKMIANAKIDKVVFERCLDMREPWELFKKADVYAYWRKPLNILNSM